MTTQPNPRDRRSVHRNGMTFWLRLDGAWGGTPNEGGLGAKVPNRIPFDTLPEGERHS